MINNNNNNNPIFPKYILPHTKNYFNNPNNEKAKVLSNGIQFIGDFSQGQNEQEQTGTGLKTFPNGTKHYGTFLKRNLEGNGKIFQSNGTIIEGEFKEGFLIIGKIIQNDKTIFEGKFKNDELNGLGKITNPDGIILEGEFKADSLNGLGKITNPNGIGLKGEFKDGFLIIGKLMQHDHKKLNGSGKITIPGGITLEGEFKDGDLMPNFITLTLGTQKYVNNWTDNNIDILKIIIKDVVMDIIKNKINSDAYLSVFPLLNPFKTILPIETLRSKFKDYIKMYKMLMKCSIFIENSGLKQETNVKNNYNQYEIPILAEYFPSGTKCFNLNTLNNQNNNTDTHIIPIDAYFLKYMVGNIYSIITNGNFIHISNPFKNPYTSEEIKESDLILLISKQNNINKSIDDDIHIENLDDILKYDPQNVAKWLIYNIDNNKKSINNFPLNKIAITFIKFTNDLNVVADLLLKCLPPSAEGVPNPYRSLINGEIPNELTQFIINKCHEKNNYKVATSLLCSNHASLSQKEGQRMFLILSNEHIKANDFNAMETLIRVRLSTYYYTEVPAIKILEKILIQHNTEKANETLDLIEKFKNQIFNQGMASLKQI